MTLRNGVFAKPLTEIVTESQMYSSAFRVIGIAERVRMGILNLPTQFGKERRNVLSDPLLFYPVRYFHHFQTLLQLQIFKAHEDICNICNR